MSTAAPQSDTISEFAPAVSAQIQHEIEHFLYQESRLLDERRYQEWITLFTDDSTYTIPVQVNREDDAEWETRSRAFDDTKQTLQIRVDRLGTEYAWAERPPSRVRHFISNVIVEPTSDLDEFSTLSNELIYRSRGEDTRYDLISARRVDRLRRSAAGWRIARRWVSLDQATVAVHNLAMFF